MEELFLIILNMSITAGYVIPAVIFIRLLLKRAPKKYSYLLWSVVLFRLICPVSFSSVCSIFQIQPFDMTAAFRGSRVSLNFIPADIGYMKTPRVTVGIPAINSLISGSLPTAAPNTSANLLQIWIFFGTILWCIGIATLLIYSIVTYIRLKHRVSTAVRLEGNVYETDKIRSPFILGFVLPRIYIPFGLGVQESEYILRHERYHLKRKDYLVKALSFCVLAIHWFNPLVWLAFVLMTQDMEMSCDEKVLSETDTDIVHDYSTSLLAFAANRRIPAASPLAFGEAGIRERVKNILRFKKPKKWVVILTAILCVTAVITCAANPLKEAITKSNDVPYGNYVFEKQIYMNPLSSFMVLDGFKEYYTLTKNLLILTDKTGIQQRYAVTYQKDLVDEQTFKNSFMININIPDVTKYKDKYQYTLTNTSGSAVYRIYLMDDEIWLAQIHKDSANTQKSEYIWSIYKITRIGDIPMKATISGTQDGVLDFLSHQQNFKSGYNNDTCYNITPNYIRQNSDYLIFKYDTSCASLLLYEDKIYPLGEWFGGYGLTSMSLFDLDGDQKPELYFTYSFGSGLHRSNAAYFDPIANKVIVFNYTHPNSDMLITPNYDGGLSLYDADIKTIDSFVNFEIEKKDYISDITYENGQISLNPIPKK
ncbi:M56 family metallopeptidase [Anaerocolumna sp. MB42-C2]|uniref:M56 family metallopeptidase n=1 Tax=Anaerocolumna sp. MB42-C2 TaxID=3070997 RepID=UPI0027E0DC46|nr:M56 family metallopeptidase [Anaerocolumna sp. MB42-C2]WMJ89195.1 M56 family metallopeptidase [Anaerocolumna sp. MB42-C2]